MGKRTCFIKYLLFIFIIIISFNSCNYSITEPITKSSFLLNTVVTITIYDKKDEKILDNAMDLISEYEEIYSRTDEKSELSKVNNALLSNSNVQRLDISEELFDVIKYGLDYSKLSNGAFDITIAPIISLWDFTVEEDIIPSESDINNALQYVDYKNLLLKNNQIISYQLGSSIDLGGIAKGYIADKVKEFLISTGVESAIINLGGNVLCIGEKPDGTPFKIGIQKPYADRDETAAIMEITDLSVVSSGIYERYFNVDGKTYHHIIDPTTGYPFDNDLVSVSIISERSVDGDGLSTSCFSLGLEEGMELVNSIPNTYGIFITKDYQIHYSNDFDDAINIIQ